MKKRLLIIFLSVIFAEGYSQTCVAGFTYTINGSAVTFTNTSTGATSIPYYGWNFGDGNSSGAVNPIHTYQYNGSYLVCLSYGDTLNPNCSDYFCDTITITNGNPPPCNPSFSYYVDTANGSVWFNDQSTYQPVNWFWDFGDGNYDSTGNPNPVHFYAVQDTYIVCLTVINNAGDTCSACDTINSIPCSLQLNTSFAFSISTDTAFFTNTSSGASTPNYFWSFGDGNYSNVQNPTHAYLYNGTYIACVTYGDTFCVEQFCDTIIITNGSGAPCNAQFSYYVYPDTILFPFDTLVQFYDQSVLNPSSWYWDFGDGNNSTLQNPVHQYAVSGDYYVCLIIINQSSDTCTTCDSVAARLQATGINTFAENNIPLKNYPNPFSTTTTIVYSLMEKTDVNISVYTNMGLKVAELENSIREAGNHQLEWNAGTLSDGIYLLEVKANNSIMTRKLVLIK